MFDSINPVKLYRQIGLTLSEAKDYWTYLKVIKKLQTDGEFEKIKLRVTDFGRAFYIVNLQPELLIYEKEGPTELQKLEMTKVKESLKEYNEFYINHLLIDYVKTDFERIRTEDYYAYLVWIDFAYNHLKRENLIQLATRFGIQFGITATTLGLIALKLFL